MVFKSAQTIQPSHQDLASYVLNHENYDASKEILIDVNNPRRVITLGMARTLVQKLSSALPKRGLARNGTVCLHIFNDIMFPILFLGIVAARGRFTGSNPAYTPTELCHHFKISETQFIITQRAHLKPVKEAAEKAGVPLSNIILLETGEEICPQPEKFTTVKELLQYEAEPWQSFTNEEESNSTIVSLMSTSGTTGLPKMAARTHFSWITENQAIEDTVGKPYEVRRLLCVPFFHGFAAPLALVSALRSGHTTYVMRKFDQEHFLCSVRRFNITETAIAPPLVTKFLALPECEQAKLRSLKMVWCAGAALPYAQQEQAVRVLFSCNARLNQVWGMTEGGWITTFHHPESDETGSVGRLNAGFEAKIVGEDGQELTEEGAIGEIVVRGLPIMIGYYGDADATKETIDEEGWMKTGDVASIRDGKVYIVGRSKEIIKLRGWQVAPAELEGTLLSHDGITDAAVLGVQQEDQAYEVPRAYVVCKDNVKLSAEEVKTYLLKFLAKYKVGDCQIRFRDSIPKSSTGKTLRKQLVQEVHQEQGVEATTDNPV